MIKKLMMLIVLIAAVFNGTVYAKPKFNIWTNYDLKHRNGQYASISVTTTRESTGSLTRTTYIYDPQGYLQREEVFWVEDNKEYNTVTKYDYIANKLAKIERTGQDPHISIVKYDDNSKRIFEYYADMKTGKTLEDMKTTYEYNKEGLLVKEVCPFAPERWDYEYDKNKGLIHYKYYGDGSTSKFDVERTVDDMGRIIQEKVTRRTIYLNEKKPTEITIDDFFYDGDNCVKEIINKIRGSKKTLKEVIQYEYYKDKTLKSEQHIDKNGKTRKKTVYEYKSF